MLGGWKGHGDSRKSRTWGIPDPGPSFVNVNPGNAGLRTRRENTYTYSITIKNPDSSFRAQNPISFASQLT